MDLRRRQITPQRRSLSQALGPSASAAPSRSRPGSAPRRKGGPQEQSSIWSKDPDQRHDGPLAGPILSRKASAPSLGPPPRWSSGPDQGFSVGHRQAAPSSAGYDSRGIGPGLRRTASATQVGPRSGGYGGGGAARPGASSVPRRRPQPSSASFDGGHTNSGGAGGYSSFLDRSFNPDNTNNNRSYHEGYANRNDALQLEVSLTERLREHSRSLLVDHSQTDHPQDPRQRQIPDDRGSMRGERSFDTSSRMAWQGREEARDPASLQRYRFEQKPRGFADQGRRQGGHGPHPDGRQERSYDRRPGQAGMRPPDDRSYDHRPVAGGMRAQDDRSYDRGPGLGGSRPPSASSMYSQGPAGMSRPQSASSLHSQGQGGDRGAGRPRRPTSDQHRGGALPRNSDDKRPDSRAHSPEKHRNGEVKRGGEGFHTASTMTPLSTATEMSRGDPGVSGGGPLSMEGRTPEDMGLPESRLKIYSDLFEEVIERDKVFGSLLRKIKTAYDSLLRPGERRPQSVPMEAHLSGASGAGPMQCSGNEIGTRHLGRGMGPEDQVSDRPQIRELNRQNRVLKDLVERLHLELEEAVKREQKYRHKAARLSADAAEVGSPGASGSPQHSTLKPHGAGPRTIPQYPGYTAGFNAMRREPPSSADLESSGVLNQGGLLSLSSISPQGQSQHTESLEASKTHGSMPPVQYDPLDDTRSDMESLDSERLPQKPTQRRCPKPKCIPPLDFTILAKMDDEAEDSDVEDGGMIAAEGYSDEELEGSEVSGDMRYGEGEDSSPPGSPSYKGERPGDPVSQTLASEESQGQPRRPQAVSHQVPAFEWDSNSEDGLHEAEDQE